MRKPIRRDIQRNSHALVVHELGQKIVAGTYSVGTLLPGDGELAEKFQVSRTVLREAMKTLSAKGLIAPRAGIGTRVTEESSWNLFDADVLTWYFQRGITEEFMNHLTEMRQAIEPAAARLAAKNATRKDILELYSLVEDMNEATTAHELAVMDLEFHLKLLSASKNPFMNSVGSLIEAALVGVFRLSSPPKAGDRMTEVVSSHKHIVDMIDARDEVAAAAAMSHVIVRGRERVFAYDTDAGS
ncbi:MAG: FadR/GntR family transcriptional regulator [Rhizobiaceae bacterium]|nr:FadR/GntR family transcriptional regulator [Rhizobiaceae bacterium]|tara:strand:+ start:36302 stop:37030 length:729 start_codon:yes stop_codon:yes gene_type:complete